MRCKIPAKDLAQKLDATVCRYKGLPVNVRIDHHDIILYEMPSASKKVAVLQDPLDPYFDVSTVPLGYCQAGTDKAPKVYYLSRSPLRRTKQGIDAKALVAQRMTAPNIGLHSILYSKGFVSMVTKSFISLDSALLSMRALWKENFTVHAEYAIHINIALHINDMGIISVYYKGKKVGWIPPDTKTVIVPHNDYGWVVSKYLSGFSWEVK